MAGRRIYAAAGGGGAGSNMSVLLQNQRPNSSSEPVDAFFLSGSSPFLGSSSMLSFEDVHGQKRSNGLFFCPIEQEENGDEDFDEYNHAGKKRRLTSDQVRFLERSFEVDNKLEPERKVQLAKDLNLQPRQVAIWFQNRRARWKSKQLEKDYDALQARFNNLKTNYDSLLREKENLRAEVHLLTEKLHLTDKEIGNPPQFSDATEASQVPPQDPIAELGSEVEESKVSIVAFKQEDLNSAKSDVFESESPHYTEGGHCSSYVFDHDYHSDLSQDEEDNLRRSLLPPLCIFPKLEDADFPDSPANSCNLGGFLAEDHAIWSWYF